jgi:post-segregation antitoxin (ccd killing protein)
LALVINVTAILLHLRCLSRPRRVCIACGVTRVNVYLPDQLAADAKKAGLNLSAVTQEAVRSALAARSTDAWLDILAASPVQRPGAGRARRSTGRAADSPWLCIEPTNWMQTQLRPSCNSSPHHPSNGMPSTRFCLAREHVAISSASSTRCMASWPYPKIYR